MRKETKKDKKGKRAYIALEDRDKTSSENSDKNDISKLCLMVKNHREEVNDDELKYLPKYEQLE